MRFQLNELGFWPVFELCESANAGHLTLRALKSPFCLVLPGITGLSDSVFPESALNVTPGLRDGQSHG